MATQVQIECIKKSNRYNPHERIVSVGGRNPDGSRWELTQSAAITGIERGDWQFYVSRGGFNAWVVVAVSQWGNKYIKTQSDGEQPDNLLSLPTCPESGP